jgi:hypothetical protein
MSAIQSGITSGTPVTGNGVTNTLGTWTSYLAGAPNPNIVLGAVSPAGLLPSSGSLVSTPLGWAISASSDNASGGTTDVGSPSLLYVQDYFGGSAIDTGRNAILSIMQFTAPTSPSNPYRFYVGISSYVSLLSGDNGTEGAPAGDFEAGTDQIDCTATCTHLFALVAHEFSISAEAGSSVKNKADLILNDWPSDAVHGSAVDAFIWTYGQGVGLNTWAEIDKSTAAPLTTAATLINLGGSAWTIANGINFGTVTVTGSVLKWIGVGSQTFSLAGNGDAALNTVFANGLQLAGAGGLFITGTLPTGTPAAYACFTAGQELISSATPC